MKTIKKILKWTGITVLGLIVIANLVILLSGRLYIYKAIASTYFRGYTKPSIYDQTVFETRKVEAMVKSSPWQISEFTAKVFLKPEERSRIEALNPASFLVIHDNSIIYEEYWNDHNKNKTSNSFSMAKSIVALLVGIAVDEGKIQSIDDPVSKYLKEFDDEKKDITIRQILTMSSGLSWSESYIHPFCDVAELYYDTDARDLSLNRREVEEKPGVNWAYKSGDTQVLVYLLEETTGQNISDYASEKIWQPIGAESDALWSLTGDNASLEKGFCCFYATTRDFARLGSLINHQGYSSALFGQQIVDSSYVKEMCMLAPLKKASNGKPNNCYGLQYWIYTGKPYQITYFRGMSGQYIISIPSKDLVIVRTGNGTEGNVADSKDPVEGHYAELPFYIEVGERILSEFETTQ